MAFGTVEITAVKSDAFAFTSGPTIALPAMECGVTVPTEFHVGSPVHGPFHITIEFKIAGPLGLGIPFAQAILTMYGHDAGIGTPLSTDAQGRTCYQQGARANAQGVGYFTIPISGGLGYQGQGVGSAQITVKGNIGPIPIGEAPSINLNWHP